jgi:DNA-binding MarR family transcriptional regulator
VAATSSELLSLTVDEEAFIRSLDHLIHTYSRALDGDLHRAHGMTLVEYLTLMHLSEAPDRRLRMSELASSCNLSLSGMTRVVDRLEKQGMIQRVKCAEDLRGANAVLTDAGFDRLQQAWPTFLGGARRYVFDHLEGLPLGKIARALEACAAAGDEAAS